MSRRVLLFLSIAPVLPAQIVITPSTPTVRQGETIQFTADKPVTWSLTPGSAGTIDSITGLYTAPSTVTVPQKVGPCQMLPPDHIYNTRVDALPVHPDSAALMALGGGNFRIGFQPSFGTNIMTNATPTFDAVFYYTPLNNGPFRILPWPELKRESGVFTPPFSGVDRHVTSVNRETCEFSDIYNNYDPGDNNASVQNCPLCTAQSGVQYSGSSFALPTTGATDAAGMAQQPVSVRLSDIQSGTINHALRFTLANGYIKPAYVWPATANAYPYCTGTCFEYGMYLRLKSSYDIAAFSPSAQILLTALKNYGMILTDGGTSFGIQTDTDVFLDPASRAALTEILASTLRSSDFEVVDASPLKRNASSGAVALGNGYVTPAQYAEVVAADASMNTATARIALRGVVVGVPDPVMTIMAGHQVQLTAWVTGSADTTVTWSMSPAAGTLTSEGLYTAPSGITTPLRVRITASSAVEPAATAVIDATIWPDDEGGTIRVSAGAATDRVDVSGHKWWGDQYFQVEGFGYIWTGGPPNSQYTETRYFYGDAVMKWWLPNGNYRARLYTSINTGTGPIPATGFVCHYEAQGQLVRSNLPVSRIVGTSRFQGGYLDMPLEVTGGSAYIALRNLAGPSPYCSISAVEISPDPATTPYIEIDSAGADGDITIGRTRQFHSVGWYMPNTVTWSVLSGPGSIDANGLYTAPSTPPSGTQAVTVRATSTVDSSKTADISFDFVFGTIIVTPATATVPWTLSRQFAATLGGTPYGNVTWSINPTVGTIGPAGLYTAPDQLVEDTPVVVTATSNDDPSQSASANMIVTKTAPPIRVNCGGAQFTDGQGQTWLADYGYSSPSQVYSGSDPIQNSAQDMWPLYQSSRYRYKGETFSYQFRLPPGSYRVTLKWAEYRTADQGMKMDVKIQGITVLRNFNPVADAGGLLRAVDKTFLASVSGGYLNLTFIGAPTATYVGAAINGIEIVQDTSPRSVHLRERVAARQGVHFK
ncbi:MAG: hypothetical protein IT166_01880 [Bryobacterales bacterium]|nr:hypothetical protein [Bryobacterales bacterium]